MTIVDALTGRVLRFPNLQHQGDYATFLPLFWSFLPVTTLPLSLTPVSCLRVGRLPERPFQSWASGIMRCLPDVICWPAGQPQSQLLTALGSILSVSCLVLAVGRPITQRDIIYALCRMFLQPCFAIVTNTLRALVVLQAAPAVRRSKFACHKRQWPSYIIRLFSVVIVTVTALDDARV